jgi:hypothetical protein
VVSGREETRQARLVAACALVPVRWTPPDCDGRMPLHLDCDGRGPKVDGAGARCLGFAQPMLAACARCLGFSRPTKITFRMQELVSGLKVADQRGTNAGVTGSILPNALFTPRLLNESLGLGNAQAVANVPPGNL